MTDNFETYDWDIYNSASAVSLTRNRSRSGDIGIAIVFASETILQRNNEITRFCILFISHSRAAPSLLLLILVCRMKAVYALCGYSCVHNFHDKYMRRGIFEFTVH